MASDEDVARVAYYLERVFGVLLDLDAITGGAAIPREDWLAIAGALLDDLDEFRETVRIHRQ